MDFDLPGEDDPRRQEVRRWLESNPDPTPQQLRDSGYLVPHWPKPWGLEADPVHQLIINDELKRAMVNRPINPIGTGHCGPILVLHGTEEQKQRYIPPMLTAEEIWCQLFSEPGSGSDLAACSTRAERHDGEYIVNGQKVWTSLAHQAKFGILLARTDPTLPKHQGLSYFIVDMESPGVEIRPLVEMTGTHLFNEVFFTDVAVPAENRIGDENNGWNMARDTLANERVSLSRGGLTWGNGPVARDLVDLVRTQGGAPNDVLRQRLVDIFIEGEIIRIQGMRMVAAAVAGRPGPESSLRKALCDPHGQDAYILSRDLAGAAGMLKTAGPVGGDPTWWADGFLFAPALTVGGGTSEILRNVISERLLGLPREREEDENKPWNETRRKQTTRA